MSHGRHLYHEVRDVVLLNPPSLSVTCYNEIISSIFNFHNLAPRKLYRNEFYPGNPCSLSNARLQRQAQNDGSKTGNAKNTRDGKQWTMHNLFPTWNLVQMRMHKLPSNSGPWSRTHFSSCTKPMQHSEVHHRSADSYIRCEGFSYAQTQNLGKLSDMKLSSTGTFTPSPSHFGRTSV